MLKNYSEILQNGDIPLCEMCEYIEKPSKVYKYQGFYQTKDNEYIESPYWSNNMKGDFHLSLGREFEDKNDCRPYINKQAVISGIRNFFKKMNTEDELLNQIEKGLEESINDTTLAQITDKYQGTISIGCFTQKKTNEDMWNDYADSSKGFCIEYDTSKNELFRNSMIPIYYSDIPYDSSWTMIAGLILTSTQKGKARTLEDNIKIYGQTYERILKTTYIPLFYKNTRFSYEEEWRMFLLEHRTHNGRAINRENFIESNNNINLSEAISAIYLGINFKQNADYEEKLSIIKRVVKEKQIKLYQMESKDGKLNPLLVDL